MARTYSQQYRPLTTGGAVGVSETADGSALSTRAYLDHRLNTNNLYGRAVARNLVMTWWNASNGVSLSGAVTRLAHWLVPAPSGFSTIQWKLFARNSQAGKKTTVLLYSDYQLYTTAFSADAASGSVSVTSNSFGWYEAETTIVRTADVYPPMTHLTLQVTNSDASYVSELYCLGAWLKPLADE